VDSLSLVSPGVSSGGGGEGGLALFGELILLLSTIPNPPALELPELNGVPPGVPPPGGSDIEDDEEIPTMELAELPNGTLLVPPLGVLLELPVFPPEFSELLELSPASFPCPPADDELLKLSLAFVTGDTSSFTPVDPSPLDTVNSPSALLPLLLLLPVLVIVLPPL